MRSTFFSTLVDLAERDERIFLLTADLGYMAVEQFSERFPKRFINVGVAEQNMVGIATGMAEAGLIPFVYSITPFSVLRPYEFIRNGPIYHQFPVRIIGIGGGLEYSHDGISHYGIEDIGVLRIQPGITLVAPADARQTATALQKTWDLTGPVYYRLGKNEQYEMPGLNGKFETGRLQVVRKGEDVLLVSLGGIGEQVCQCADLLEAQGIHATHVLLSTLNPSPDKELLHLMASHPLVITVEAHYIWGGIGSYAAELIAEHQPGCQLVRCGISGKVSGRGGSQSYLYQLHSLTAEALAGRTIKAIRQKKG